MYAALAILAAFAFIYSIVAGRIERTAITGPIVFMFFFGAGMYIAAIVQVAWVAYPEYTVSEYTAHFGAAQIEFTSVEYYWGLALGLLAAPVGCVLFAIVFGWIIFGLRGPYFAIGTLGIALAAGELIGTWSWVGGGGGIALPVYPGEPDDRAQLFYFMCFVLAVLTFVFLKWIYGGRFGLAINAIRDDEEKAEGMGLHTLRYKTVA